MKNSFGRTLACAALLCAGVTTAQAQQLKVGYVDVQKVINESAPATSPDPFVARCRSLRPPGLTI